MAGYIGTQAVSVNTTSATISDDLAVGDDALITGTLTTTAATVFNGGFTANEVSTISDATSFSSGLTIANTADTHGSVIDFFNNSSSPADNDYIGGLIFKETNSAGGTHSFAKIFGLALDITDGTEDGAITFETSAAGAATAERLRIDQVGNILVGKAATDSDANGVELNPAGFVYITANNTLPLYINRRGTSNDNELARFADDGAERGSISSSFANELMISASGTNSSGILFSQSNQVRPAKNGATSDATQDLGVGNGRWKDLYLSGGVLLGGTGAANKLDDVETGTWNPTFNGYATGFKGTYVRVGMANGGTVTCRITRWASIPSGSFSGNLTITGLPFTAGANGTNSSGSGQNTHQMHTRAAATGQANAPWGMINGTSIMMHLPSVFGSTNVYPGQAATYDSAKFTQNGNTSVILDFTFTYLTT